MGPVARGRRSKEPFWSKRESTAGAEAISLRAFTLRRLRNWLIAAFWVLLVPLDVTAVAASESHEMLAPRLREDISPLS
jgi:hypothetical protein